MKLNNYSYAHKRIRLLCVQLEQLSGLSLLTDLSTDFDEIILNNKLSYIRIDYTNKVCFTLSHKMTKAELETIKDIMLYCNWLEIKKYINKMG